ncbi:MAG: sugar transferase [Oscillospiraceae bacterium]|nr:sugar transferase [Oscillospiraceae bacterium]
MIPLSFEQLPESIRIEAVKPYYEALNRHRASLVLKRCFDIFLSLILIIVLSPLMLFIAVAVKLGSPGPVFYRQKRITSYGKEFRIYKFRSMIVDADKVGPLVTTGGDSRITPVGKVIRKTHLDEIPQLFNVLSGDMSFVGTRPEVQKYVEQYSDEMKATLLLPAGITSEASIRFRDEAEQIAGAEDADKVYVEEILPQKMAINLDYLLHFSWWADLSIMLRTFFLIFRR